MEKSNYSAGTISMQEKQPLLPNVKVNTGSDIYAKKFAGKDTKSNPVFRKGYEKVGK